MNKIRRIMGMILISVSILCILGGCDIVDDFRSEKDLVDYNSTYGVSDGEYTITLNNTMLEAKAIDDGAGNVYMDVNTANKYYNSRIYWQADENIILYATPEGMAEYTPDSTSYTVGVSTASSSIPVIINRDGMLNVSLEFLKENTKMDCAVYNEPNRVVTRTNWDDAYMTTVTEKKAVIRYQGGIKSPIFRNLEKGERLYVLDDGAGDEWAQVVTEDGYNGWVENKYLDTPLMTGLEEPTFNAPVFTSISKNYKINLAWHGVYSEAANEELGQILTEVPGINTISPRWFYFANTEGDMVTLGSADYVNTAHAAGVEVWAMFSNEFTNFDGEMTNEILSSRTKRQHVLNQLSGWIDEYQLDGINLDFEMIGESGADNYIQFVRELSALCREKQIVFSIDNYTPMYWRHYNHKEEGVFADYIIIMGYDEHHTGSDVAGSVASMGFVRQGIEDMLAMVPKEKVINAIPLYTRVWATDANGVVESFNAGMTEAAGYLESHGVTPVYDESTGQNYGEYMSEIDGRRYQIWLEDQTSLRSRLEMIQEYDLAGVASWSIGWESGPEIWQIIASYFN